MTASFFLKRRETILRLRQFRFRGGGAHDKFRAALFVGSDARFSTVAFERDLVEPLAILPRLGLDRIAALGAFRMVLFRFMHALGLLADVLGQLQILGG